MENNLEEKLGAILSDPDIMQKIQAMAQTLGQSDPPVQQTQKADPDLGRIQQLAGLAGQTAIDTDQQYLLSALSPYLSTARVQKLEKAMRAAKLAKLASAFLGNGGLQMLKGR